MAIDFSKLRFISNRRIDKIVSGGFDPIITTHTTPASTNDSMTVANPFGKKALPTMMWSVDGVNFYPARVKFPLPGLGVTAGIMCSDSTVYFYFTNQNGSPVTFTCKWVLDFIDT